MLILDDWALAPLEPAVRADLLEIIDDRAGTRSRATIVTTQLPVDHWHGWLGDRVGCCRLGCTSTMASGPLERAANARLSG